MYEDIKVAFFDFDRTLFTHDYPYARFVHESYEDECYIHLKFQAEKCENDKPVKAMQWLVKYLQARGCVIYTLSQEIFNLRDEYKKNAAARYYGIKKYLTVDTVSHKIDMIRAVARFHGVDLSECLFVDDKITAIYEACEAGIAGVHTSNVCQQYEDVLCMTPACPEGCEYPTCVLEPSGKCPYTTESSVPTGWGEDFMNKPVLEVSNG